MADSKKNPKGKERSTVSQEEILGQLSAMTKELTEMRATSVKYPALTKILRSAAQELPPHTRLPGIRDLALCLGASLVTMQRAVAELLNEKVLYSKPRSGVFVSDRDVEESSAGPPTPPVPFSPGTGHPFRAVFEFCTDSAASYQKKFWENLAALFSRQYPNVTPSLHFGADLLQSSKFFDVCERYDWDRFSSWKVDDVLDIAGFAGSLLPIPPARGRLLPLYYRTYFLFYNDSLLEKHGLPKPAYHTFDAQADYLRHLVPELARLGFNPKPYSTQEPATLFGGKIVEFSHLLEENPADPRLKKQFIELIEKLASYCRLFRYSLKDRNDWMQARQEFLNGREPFFMGYSVDYWEFSQKKFPFRLKNYPTLCCDDTFFLWPRVGAISRHSEHPVESTHFLLFLLCEDVQKRFCATGNFGANLSDNLYPEMAVDPAWMAQVLHRSSPFHFTTKEGYYMAVNVLGGELWRSLVGEIPSQKTLDQAIQMGRSYLSHRPANRVGKAGDSRLH